MKNRLLFSIIAMGLTTALPLSAKTIRQNTQHTHPYAEINMDSVAHDAMEGNLPEEFKSPQTKHLAVHTNDNKFHLSVGGQLKVTAGMDFGSTIESPNEFVTSAIPMHPEPGNGAAFKYSAMQSSIYLNFVALPGTDNQVGAFISMNFLNDYAPVLQFAYLKYRGLTAGYNYSVFADMGAAVPTIDYEGPSSFCSVPMAMASYEHSFGKKGEWTVGAGIQEPQYSVTNGNNAVSVTQRVPDIPAYVKYSWGEGESWIRFSGIIRNLYYRNQLAQHNVDKVGWGVKMSGKVSICPNLTAFYQALYGRGIASMMQDLGGGGMDMTPSASSVGEMTPVKAWGGFLGLQYDISKRVYCSATYSHVRTYAEQYPSDKAETLWGDQYRYAQYAVANVFWDINSHLQTGLEYIYGRRVNYDGSQAHDNRLQCMLQLTF